MNITLKCSVIDDEPLARELICSFVKKTPFLELENSYASASEAVRSIIDGKVDLVFLDIQMPELDGIEATRRIRAFLPDIPIIAMTAHTMKGDAEKCLEAGMQDHIAKPIDPETLFAALQRARG